MCQRRSLPGSHKMPQVEPGLAHKLHKCGGKIFANLGAGISVFLNIVY